MLAGRWCNKTAKCCHNKILIFIHCCYVFTVILKHFVSVLKSPTRGPCSCELLRASYKSEQPKVRAQGKAANMLALCCEYKLRSLHVMNCTSNNETVRKCVRSDSGSGRCLCRKKPSVPTEENSGRVSV